MFDVKVNQLSDIQVIKRDKVTIVPFDYSKIKEAIYKASIGTLSEDESRELSEKAGVLSLFDISKLVNGRKEVGVEDIQNIIEKSLVSLGQYNIARKYIVYRERRKELREDKSFFDVDKIIGTYVDKTDWRINENANIDYSLGGLILHNSASVTASYWLHKIYPEEIRKAHTDGNIHIHDLSMLSGYCAGWSLRDLIIKGIKGVSGKIASCPAKHFDTIINQMVNFLGILQNEWAGAQAFSSFDTYLAPFVAVDELTFSELKQKIQSFIYGVNTPSRWGCQSPFTNVTFDLTCPDDLKTHPAIVGGAPYKDMTYGDFQHEMNMINTAFLEIMFEGDANGRIFPYPIPTYNLTKDFNWDDPNYELLWKLTGKYGTPYFQNFISSDRNPEDVRSMCCHLSLDKAILRKRGGALFGSDELTGSIGVVTINLGRLGFLSSTKDDYFIKLKEITCIAKESLEIKKKIIKKLSSDGMYPFTTQYLRNWDNHFLTIGVIGMHECCMNFLKKGIETKEGKKFAAETLDFLRDMIVKFQEDTGNLYNLEATPGEGTSYRLAKIDRKKFGNKIYISGTNDPYYTNSTQLPVYSSDDIFEIFDHQEELQIKYTGGTVIHCFMGEMISDPTTVRNLLRSIATNYKIPYFTLTPTFSICKNHGYIPGEVKSCGICGEETEVYSRVVGYYRPVKQWNLGKKEEFKDRKFFQLN